MLNPADIVLTRTTGTLSAISLVSQTAATLSRSRFTHVLVCVAPGTLLDSVPKHGVKVRNVLHEVIAGRLTEAMCTAGYLKVLRAKNIAEETDEGIVGEQMWAAFRNASAQLKKKYNKRFFLPSASDSASQTAVSKDAFCSELVMLVLRPLEILPSKFVRPSAVLPVHFQALASDPGWVDITPTIKKWLGTVEGWANSFDNEDAVMLAQLMAHFNMSVSQIKANRGFTDAAATLDNVLERASKLLAQV